MTKRNIEKAIADAAPHYTALAHGSYHGGSFDINSTTTVRSSYRKHDYDYFRGTDLPTDIEDILKVCNEAYKCFGIVRNVIDLMGDFCVRGIELQHRNKNIEAFYKQWFHHVKGKEVSERFCNYLLRLANVAVLKTEARVNKKTETEWKKIRGFHNLKVDKRTIPSSYYFVNTAFLKPVKEEINSFLNKGIYSIRVPQSIQNICSLNSRSDTKLNSILESIPEAIVNKIRKEGDHLILVDGVDMDLHHYKKDDWESWACPIIYSILEPLMMLRKMHLADMSALDGAISNIRLWKMGLIDPNDIRNSIIPNAAGINQLRDIIKNNISGGVLDLIWGPDLDFKESATKVHEYLGPEKYYQVMSEIYDGLGVPPTLTGAGNVSGSSGFTNNFISMKVLIERLNYVREKLRGFWMKEVKIVQKAMGFVSPPEITFDDAVLTDEASEKQLILDLYDRDIISLEAVRKKFNFVDGIQKTRIKKESNDMEKGNIPWKAGPYHNPQWAIDLESELVKGGLVTKEGLKIATRLADYDFSETIDGPSEDGKNGKFDPSKRNGRPRGKKDSQPRKQKKVMPRTSASEFYARFHWAQEAWNKLTDVVNPVFLKKFKKKNVRSLTAEEYNKLHDLKTCTLFSLSSNSLLTDGDIMHAMNNLKDIQSNLLIRNDIEKEVKNKLNRDLTIEDRIKVNCCAFSILN